MRDPRGGCRTRAARLGVGLLAAALLPSCSATNATSISPPSGAPASNESAAGAAAGASGAPAAGASAPVRGLPTTAELARARREVAKLPTARLAAQLVVPRQQGTAAQAAALVRAKGYGGVAVFRGNLPADGRAAVAAARSGNAAISGAVRASGRPWPAFLGIDQEGGPVTRLDAPLTRFPALMALGATGDAALARQVGVASGAELRGLGYTVVMAPSADVTAGPSDPTIGVRSAGSDPALVSRVAGGVARGYLDAGIVPTLKHFPGHGSLSTDTHVGVARQNASLATLRSRDLRPFREAVAAGVPAVMTAHVVVAALDKANPATLSPAVLDGLLRRDLGFRGLVVTDALEMGGAAGAGGAGEVAVRAVRAGADVLLMPTDPVAAAAGLTRAVSTGRLSRARLEESAARMVATLRTGVRGAGSAPGTHAAVATRLARASIVQLGGACGRDVVGRAVSVSGGAAQDRADFAAAARRSGLRVGSGTRVVLLGGGAYRAGSGEGSGRAAGNGDVVVALDVPYGLARSTARKGRFATFGRTPATFAALVDVLRGRAPARGRLPVAVGAAQIGTGCTGGSS